MAKIVLEEKMIDELAARHGFSRDAVKCLLHACIAGGGAMAQFNHPELGGMGQWSSGMIMIGDIFNNQLKGRVSGLCSEAAALVSGSLINDASVIGSNSGWPNSGWPNSGSPASPTIFSNGSWWPSHLGSPSTCGSQNDIRYAYFPDLQRLALCQNGIVTEYDTQGYEIMGVSQSQGSQTTLVFSCRARAGASADAAKLLNLSDFRQLTR